LDRKVLEWIERKVEEGVFASRSHAVEYAVRQLMRQERKQNIIS
jgi:Arc/MetJ-type ribon-helix-helix transcriptional regulator